MLFRLGACRNPESAIVVYLFDDRLANYYTSNVAEVFRPRVLRESAVIRGVGRTRLIADHYDRGGGIYTL